MDEKVSLKQALLQISAGLANISVPVSMLQQIGVPISAAIANIESCIAALENAEKEIDKLKRESQDTPPKEEVIEDADQVCPG